MFKTRRLSAPDPKLTGSLSGLPASGPVSVIVRVSRPGHVPSAATLRTRIDDSLFTADVDAARLEEITADPYVVAVSPAKPVGPASA